MFSLWSIECPETWIYWAINNISYWNFMKWCLWESAKWECVYFSAKWIAITPGEAGKRGLKFSQTWLHLTSNKHKWLRLWQRPDLLSDSWLTVGLCWRVCFISPNWGRLKNKSRRLIISPKKYATGPQHTVPWFAGLTPKFKKNVQK